MIESTTADAPGTTRITYDELASIYGACQVIANRALPDPPGGPPKIAQYWAAAVRMLKPFVAEYENVCAAAKRPFIVDPAAVGAMSREEIWARRVAIEEALHNASRLTVAVVLPRKATDDMLPKKVDWKKGNDDGLAALMSDLGPVYDLPTAV